MLQRVAASAEDNSTVKKSYSSSSSSLLSTLKIGLWNVKIKLVQTFSQPILRADIRMSGDFCLVILKCFDFCIVGTV